MGKTIIDWLFDFTPFKFETTTQIPMEKLVYIICDFYWNMGHKKIGLMVNPNKPPWIDYKPDLKLEEADQIKKISVNTYKKENKQKFDSVHFLFEKIEGNKIKINGRLSFGFKIWDFIYFIIALIYSFHLAGQPFISGFMATIVFFVSLIPMFLLGSLRIKRNVKNPNVARYKREFGEHIRMKEKELFPELYE